MAPRMSFAEALPYANAALFALQILLTWFAFPRSDTPAQFQTPITPAPFAFSIWNPIEFFTLMTVITDVAFPGLSIFHGAANAAPLRVCFALSCFLTTDWAWFTSMGVVNAATVDVTMLWLALLPLYLFLTVERDVRQFRWRQYLCSEIGIRLYFAWITVATVVSWAVSSQTIAGGALPLGAYVVLLGVLVVSAMVGVVYGNDPVIGLVTVWACVGITQKDVTLVSVGEPREKQVRLQAAATLAAGIVTAMVLVSAVAQWLTQRRLSRALLSSATLKGDAGLEFQRPSYGAVDAGGGSNQQQLNH